MTTILIGILVLVLVSGFFYMLLRNFNQKLKDFNEGQESRMMGFMRQDLSRMETQVTSATTRVEERLTKAAEYIAELNKEMGQMKEIGQSVRNFQSLFASPKLRGGIGEQLLKELLELSMPKSMYQIQYKFHDGSIVDSVIKVKDGIIPIDSKFPLNNYRLTVEGGTEAERTSALKEFQKDVKKHIDDISSKYIKPDEGTVDFAIMYLPSESVYAAVVDSAALTSYANTKKIGIVSPNHFYHFLQTIMTGFQAQRVSEAGQKILDGLRAISSENLKFGEELGKLNTHLNNAKNMGEQAVSRFTKLSNKIDNLMALEVGEAKEILELEETALKPKE